MTITIARFAAGIAVMLLIIAALGRTVFLRMRSGLAAKASIAKYLLGGALLFVGLLILAGFDRVISPFRARGSGLARPADNSALTVLLHSSR